MNSATSPTKLPTFPVPDLTAARRPSWFANQFYELPALLHFVALLRELAPREYRRLEPKTPRRCYVELFRVLNRRYFPVNDWSLFEVADKRAAQYEAQDGYCSWWLNGIPFTVYGLDWENDETTSPALALVVLFHHRNQNLHLHGYGLPNLDVLQPYRKLLDAELSDVDDAHPPLVNERGGALWPNRYRYAPDGRKWHAPWDRLHDLWLWVTASADNPFVDISSLQQQENELWPTWDVDEIKALAAYWRQAKPILTRARALADYVDAQPQLRLPVLLGALKLEPETLEQITYRPRPRTLAQQFLREERLRAWAAER